MYLRQKINVVGALFALTCVVACSGIQHTVDNNEQTTQPQQTILKSLPQSKTVLSIIEKAANWQVARTQYMPHVGKARRGSEAYGRWIQGAFYKGLTKVAERSENPFYEKWMSYVGNEHNWRLGKVPYFADDQVIGQMNLWYYERNKNIEAIEKIRKAFDEIISQSPITSLEFIAGRNKDNLHACQKRWCWADALFMAPPTWFGLSKVTGNAKYTEYAHKEFQATVNYLKDKNTGLYYRDSRYINKKGRFGEPMFWSRGVGWVYAGLVHSLENLPIGHKYRSYYERLYLDLTASIVKLQKQDGSWPMSLLAGEKSVEPESSGTAFFTYGLAWGVNNGLLNKERYLSGILKGWASLERSVHTDGKFGWVQGVNDKPDVVTFNDSQLYGAGAFLMAGSMIYDLAKSGEITSLQKK